MARVVQSSQAMRPVFFSVLASIFVSGALGACGGKVDGGDQGAGAGSSNTGKPGGPGNSENGVEAAADGGGSSTGLLRNIFLPVGGVDLALDDSALYVFDDTGQVTRVDKATGAVRALVAHPPLGAHTAVTLCGDAVFWVDTASTQGGNNGRILSVPKSGGDFRVFKTDLHAPKGIGCDATNVYWTEEGTYQSSIFDGVVVSAPLAGGDRVVLTDHEAWATGSLVVTDDAVIFASNLGDGVQIRRVAKTGGAVTTLSTAPGATLSIEIAFDYVLWTATTGAFYAPVAGGPATKVGDWPTQNLTFTGEHLVYEDGPSGNLRIKRARPGGVATEIGRATHAQSWNMAAVSDASGAYLMDVLPGYGTTIHIVAR